MNMFSKMFFSEVMFSRVILVLIGFSLPISTALDNLLLAVLVIFGLMVFGKEALRISYQNPVARASMMLFGVLLVASLYGTAPFAEAVGILGKYVDLALIPLLMAVMRPNQNWRYLLNGFLLAMLLTLALSYLMGFGVLDVQPWMWQRNEDVDCPAIFRHYLIQNAFMALAIFIALLRSRETTGILKRSLWIGFAMLGIINVLFMMSGRTGYVILLVLVSWFAWSTLVRDYSAKGKKISWRHAVTALLLLVTMVASAYTFSSRLHNRVDLAFSDLSAWKPGVRSDTSVGDRMEFYFNALQISRQHLLAGVGTGGFYAAYEKQVQGKDLWVVGNPHNEYLLITVQTGLIGLLLLLYLFYTLWRYAPLLDTAFKQDAARGIVLATMADSLFNSPLLDHAPGLLFALMVASLFANLETNQKRV